MLRSGSMMSKSLHQCPVCQINSNHKAHQSYNIFALHRNYQNPRLVQTPYPPFEPPQCHHPPLPDLHRSQFTAVTHHAHLLAASARNAAFATFPFLLQWALRILYQVTTPDMAKPNHLLPGSMMTQVLHHSHPHNVRRLKVGKTFWMLRG